jgi:hypothetical protein
MAQKVKGIARATMFAVLSAVVFIILGLVFFMIFLLIVKTGASLMGLEGLDANWAVFSAALLSSAVVIGAAVQRE